MTVMGVKVGRNDISRPRLAVVKTYSTLSTTLRRVKYHVTPTTRRSYRSSETVSTK